MSLTERQGKILEKIVKEHIRSARPVSSHLLEKKYSFAVCPATLRIEMQKLTDKGFLEQPHTSAGRVPTDKGYRFFVDSLFEKELSDLKYGLNIRELVKEDYEDAFRFIVELSKLLATTSSAFTTVHLSGKDFFWKEGWEEVLKEPEFKEGDIISDFSQFLKSFEKHIKDFKMDSEIEIYIGKENPFGREKRFGIISAKCSFPDKEEGIISLLGPKRMPYERNLSLINSLIKNLEEFCL
jgi:heat-inducible transcriptional repressor